MRLGVAVNRGLLAAIIIAGVQCTSVLAQSLFVRNDGYDFSGNHYLRAGGGNPDDFSIFLESGSDFRRFKLKIVKDRLHLKPLWFVTNYRVDMNNDGTWEQDWNNSNETTLTYYYPNPSNGISETHTIKIEFRYTYWPTQQSVTRTRYHQITTFSTPRVFVNGENDAFVQLRNEDCTAKIPVLMVEGFDPPNEKFPELYYNLTWDLVNSDLYPRGYEVFILNFHDGGTDLRSNAQVLMKAIDKIHEICPNYKITLAGLSMGGPIARYALAKRESHGGTHDVGLFLSYDSPQDGAHVNPGLQDWIKIQDPSTGIIGLLQENLKSIGAKQMLRYNTYDPSHILRDEFYGELNALNGDGYPHQSYNVSVSNGNFDATWGYESEGRHLLTLKVNNNLIHDVAAVKMDCGTGSMISDLTMRRYGDIFNNPFVHLYYELEILFNPAYQPTWSSLDLVNYRIDETTGNITSFDRSKFDDYVVQQIPLQHHEMSAVTRSKILYWLDKDFNITVNYDLQGGGNVAPDNYRVNLLHGIPITVQPQSVNVNGTQLTYVFDRWDDGNTSNPRTFYASHDVSYSAIMKVHLSSNSPTATATNNQRKIALSASGVYCMVYESSDRIWFSKSVDGGETWSDEYQVSNGSLGPVNKYASIVVNGEVANVIWQSVDWWGGPFLGNGFVHLRRHDLSNNSWGDVEEIASFVPESQDFLSLPAIDAALLSNDGRSDIKRVVWRSPDGIYVRDCNMGLWGSPEKVPGTHGNCSYPSIANYNGDYYGICWEDANPQTIMYMECHYQPAGDRWTFNNMTAVSPYGWGANQRPSLAIGNGNDICITWQSVDNVVEGVSVHVRQGDFGQNSWGPITSYSMGTGVRPHPIVGTSQNTEQKILIWNGGDIVYFAANSGSVWEEPKEIASGVDGGTDCSINTSSPSGHVALWRKPNGEIGRYQNPAGFASSQGVNSTKREPVSYRRNRHGIINLRHALGSGNGRVDGMAAFEISEMKVSSPRGTDTLVLSDILEGRKSLLSSRYFRVPSNSSLSFAGAVYGKKVVGLRDTTRTFNQPLARVVLKHVGSENVCKEIWRIPFSDIVTTRDSCFGSFRSIEVRLDELAGRDVYVDVDMVGHERAKPLIDDDYLIVSGRNRLNPGSLFNFSGVNLPDMYRLYQNYPNPFNPQTEIRFDLPERQQVSLTVYNVLGQEVATLFDKMLDAGDHIVTAALNGLPTGMYVYRIKAGRFSDTKKMLLLR